MSHTARIPEAFHWTTAACPTCKGCCKAILPVAQLLDADGVTLAYRCRHGHDWTCAWEIETAREHARASKAELHGHNPLGGPPVVWPDR